MAKKLTAPKIAATKKRIFDYKVRILNGGTGAVTRVLIESLDKAAGERWFTVGVSPNIVDASFQARLDFVTFKLLKSGAPGGAGS